MSKKVCLLNYGSGNTKSVYNLIDFLGYQVTISNEAKDLTSCSHLILPGVGSFGSSISKVREHIPVDLLMDTLTNRGTLFLGICVGMQLLAARGFEFGEHKGLGLIDGMVRRLESGENRLPHIGWNEVHASTGCSLFQGIPDGADFYFMHSYCFVSADDQLNTATTQYGETFVSAIQKDNIFGVQFHPEKSQIWGQRLMLNFLRLTA